MEFKIIVDSQDPDRGVRSLFRWLLDIRSTESPIVLSLSDTARPTDMGPDVESITAVVGAITAVGSLLVSIASWRDARRNAPPVTVHQSVYHVTIGDASDLDIDGAMKQLRVPDDDRPAPEPA